MRDIDAMKNLVDKLNKARYTYEQENFEIMSNKEYDALYDELLNLEKTTGIVLSNSPTQNVGYEVVSGLKTKKHSEPMLSCDKTKSVDDLIDFCGNHECRISLKLDGLTVVLVYENGILSEAITRGDGITGEIVTHNAKMFCNVPQQISFKGRLIMRGEAIITYSDFEKINSSLPAGTKTYENPRNLVSATVRSYDNSVAKKRHVRWICFKLVSAEGLDFDSFDNSMDKQLDWVASLGFEQVMSLNTNDYSVKDAVKIYDDKLKDEKSDIYDMPSDGLVVIYNDLAYGKSLGSTAKFPRDSIAFKWKDDVVDTVLRDIDWNVSRSGMVVPIAVFDPVRLEGTTVKRASLSNVSILKQLRLGIGDTISVYKANKIIPHVHENKTQSDTYELPSICPSCSKRVNIYTEPSSGVQTLYCNNSECPAKKIKTFSHFVSRGCMNIDDLSDEKLNDLISEGIVCEFIDFYNGKLLEPQIKSHILEIDGWGDKMYDSVIASIEKSKTVSVSHFLNALGVPNVGLTTAKLITDTFPDWKTWCDLQIIDLIGISGIGSNTAFGFVKYFMDNCELFNALVPCLNIISDENNDKLNGKKFVITGKLSSFAKRADLVDSITANGGVVSSSVSDATDYLICNEASNSSKYKSAVKYNVDIITESDYINMIR